MFDLENQIQQWRREAAKKVGRQNARLDELECHLRDHIEQLVRQGASGQEAFLIAVERLGDLSSISAEFRKARKVVWRPARVVNGLWILLGAGLGLMLAAKVVNHRMDFLLATHVYLVTLGYCGAFLIGALGCCFIISELLLDEAGSPAPRLERDASILVAITAACTGLGVVLGMFWTKDHLGSYWQWEPREVGGLCVFAWLLATLILEEFTTASERVVMMMGICGSLLTSLAWFGAGLLASTHAYGFPGVAGTVLSVLIVVHIVFLSMGVLPRGLLRRSGSR